MSDERTWQVKIGFNSRLLGSRQSLICTVDAFGPEEAITKGIGQAVRLPQHGQSIVVTSVSASEVLS